MSKEIIKVDNIPINPEFEKCYEIMQTSQNINTYTHSFFKYPCKFIPEIPRWAIRKYMNCEGLLFDPFCGSGTTVVEGVLAGYSCYATEIDEVAKLLISVKTTQLNSDEILFIKKFIYEIEHITLTKIEKKYKPDINNILHWFSQENIDILCALSDKIRKVENLKIKNFLNVVLASIIKKCSYCDNSSPKPYVSSKIKKEPENAKYSFIITCNKYLSLLEEFSKLPKIGSMSILDGDALNINFEGKFDLAFTSPPYINAFDYVRTMRLENLWLGLHTEKSLLESKSKYVGTEKLINKNQIYEDVLNYSSKLKEVYTKLVEIDNLRANIVLKYFDDMKKNLIEVKNHLKDNGVYGIVVGNNVIRKIEIKTSQIILEIALKVGYKIDTHFSYIIKNPYIRFPRKGRGGETKYDYVLCLRKVK